jgi:hypothetical protein
MTVIFRTNKDDWRDASLAKKQLAWHRKMEGKGEFDIAIKKEEDIVRSFVTGLEKQKEAA